MSNILYSKHKAIQAIWFFPALVTIAVIVCAIVGSRATELLMFDRIAIDSREYWRLFTAFFVHTNWAHVLINVAMLWLICAFFLYMSSLHFFALWLVLSIVVSLGLLYGVPSLQYYVGMSSLLHGLLVYAAIYYWRKSPVVHLLLITLVFLKVMRENLPGYDDVFMQELIEWPVATESHVLGFVAGVFLALLALCGSYLSRSLR